MKKTILASAITLTTLSSINAQADIAITSFFFQDPYVTSGTLFDAGGGSITSSEAFQTKFWTATQETIIMDNTGSWAGTSAQGQYNYDADIAAMTANQRAVGLFFDWNQNNDAAILEIFNCNNDGSGDSCTGTGVQWQTFVPGSISIFSGHEVSTVPVPAAVWLMGSGLLGLIGVARRRRA